MNVLILISTIGFINAACLYWQYRLSVTKKKKMYCLIGDKCGGVVGSPYGKTFGIKNEITGMAYYSCFVLLVLFSHVSPSYFGMFHTIIAGISMVAVVFSLYLVVVQVAVLKKMCVWCLIAIAINVALFAGCMLIS